MTDAATDAATGTATDPATGTAAAATSTPGGTAGAADTTTPPAAPDAAQGESIDSLPEWAQRVIRQTRQEAGTYRTKAKDAEAEAQRIRDQAAVALGLKQPDTPTDPALTAAQAAARKAATDLAVYRTAGAKGVNPDALLDSAAFQATVAALDSTSSTFTSEVEAAVLAAAASNPLLRTARAAGASAPDLPGGTGEQGAITEAALRAASPEQVVTWMTEGRLKHLL